MTIAQRLDRFWYAPAPAERLAALRACIGAYALVYLLVRAKSLLTVTRFAPAEFEPVGVVALLAEPLSALAVYGLWSIAAVSMAALMIGLRYRMSGPVAALSFLFITSYRSSFGMIFHTENLVALHLVLLSVAPAADAWSLDARKGRAQAGVEQGKYGWPLRAISAVTAVAYVIAGVAKLRLAGFAWVEGDLLRAQVAYDNLRKIELGSLHSPLGALLVRYGWPFRTLSLCSLVLELGAPLALFSARIAKVWVLGVFGFHLGVLALMAIAFPYQLSFVAYLSFFPLEQWVSRLRARSALARRVIP